MWFLQPGMTLEKIFIVILSILVTAFFILPIHEWAHAYVAYKLGDNTAKYSGRLSINPLKHLDPLGLASMILFRFGWARPVPINPKNFKNPKLGMALTALAGPLSNLIVAFIAAFGLNAFAYITFNYFQNDLFIYIFIFLYSFVGINIGLAIFNLIPLPPLDGSKILAIFLPDKFLYSYYRYERYIMIAVFLLLFSGILSIPLTFLQNLVLKGFMWITSLPFELLMGKSI